MRTFLLAAHLVTAVGLVGCDVVLLVLGAAAAGGADPVTIYPAASLVARWVLVPLLTAALATGVLQALRNGWGLLRHGWVAVKLAVTVAFAALVLGILVPRLAASAAAATAGAVTALPLVVAPAGAVAAQLALVGLALTKPRLWTRARRTLPTTAGGPR